MRTIKFLSTLAAITLVAVFFVRCSDDPAAPVINYGISGTITYPDFNGAATPAGGAVVYLKMDATEATTSYDLVTVADASGKYSFVELTDGMHSVYANYNTANTNDPNGRVAGAVFVSEGALVEVAAAEATQDFTLTSIGQAEAVAVNTYEGGDFSQDWNHSNVDFSFPYDGSNATYTGRFLAQEIYVDFDPFALGSSKIEATIDVLKIITDSPGGRDPLFNSDGTLWQDATTMAYNLGCVHGYLGMANDDPTDPNRYPTFKSTSIEAYGDGYLATADFTINGKTAPVSMYFKYIPGFVGEDRGGNPTQFSSFQGTFDFAAFQVFGISSGHIGEENDVTIDVSFQVTKAL